MLTSSKIKICGIKNLNDINIINKFDIGYVGFVFAESKRKVSKEMALELKNNLNSNIKTVGVFADMSLNDVMKISLFVGIDIVQLHSNEDNLFCKEVSKNFKVWKSISIKDENSIFVAKNYNYVDGFLLDTYNKDIRGGTGKSFTWEYARDFSKKYFTILAGGISENNIIEAYNLINPDVIDISSSVETDGRKDYYKINKIIRRIKNEYK